MFCNDVVRTKENKEVKFQLRMTEELRREFSVAAHLRGATMSSLLHQFVVKVIREEKQISPEAFLPVSQPKRLMRATVIDAVLDSGDAKMSKIQERAASRSRSKQNA